MFAGRRFDIEIGLYYNRARYYNPFIGRFLQADPIGYGDGMNTYAYCGNSPIGRVDPLGLYYDFIQPMNYDPLLLHFGEVDEETGEETVLWSGATIEEWYGWADWEEDRFDSVFRTSQPVWTLYNNSIALFGGTERLFWELMALLYLDMVSTNILEKLGDEGLAIDLNPRRINRCEWSLDSKVILWDNNQYSLGFGVDWDRSPPLAVLVHEIYHAWDYYNGYSEKYSWNNAASENYAISWENRARNVFYWNVPGWTNVYPCKHHEDSNQSWNMNPSDAWLYGDAPGRGVTYDPMRWLWVRYY